MNPIIEHTDDRSERTLRRLAIGISLAVVVGAAIGCSKDEPTGQVSQSVGRGDQPVGAVTTASATAPVRSESQGTPPPAPATWDGGEAAFQQRDYEEAARIFGVFVSTRPDHGWGHYMLGLSEWKAGRQEDAVDAFRRTLEIDPRHTKSMVNLARVLLELDRPDEARELATRAVDLDPTYVAAVRTVARSEEALGNRGEAERGYLTAIRLDPGDVWSMNNLGLLRIQSGAYEDAIGPLARATELSDDVAVFHNNLAAALEGAGYGLGALGVFERAVELDPGHRRAVASVERLSEVRGLGDRAPLDLVAYAAAFEDSVLEDEVTADDGVDSGMDSGITVPPVVLDLNAVPFPFGMPDRR